MQHQTGERQERQPRHGFWQPLIVAGQAAEARQPGEAALDHPAAGKRFYFAEGNASGSFDTYLTLENPNTSQTANVTVAFLPEQASDNVSVRTFSVAPSSRFTFKANTAMRGAFGMVVDSDQPIVAERPIYFTFGPSQGGDDVLGYQSLTLPMPQPYVAPTATPIPQPTATPAPTATPTDTPVPAPPPPPPSQSCYPLTNGGNCYEPGEYCRIADRGTTGVAGDGENIKCIDNNGWRWEPY